MFVSSKSKKCQIKLQSLQPASAAHQFKRFVFIPSEIPLYVVLDQEILRAGHDLKMSVIFMYTRLDIGLDGNSGEHTKFFHRSHRLRQFRYCRYLCNIDAPTHRTCHKALQQYWKTHIYSYSWEHLARITCHQRLCQYYRTEKTKNFGMKAWKLKPSRYPKTSASLLQLTTWQ